MEQWQIAFWTAGAVFGALTFIVTLIKGFIALNRPDNKLGIVGLENSIREHSKEDAVYQTEQIIAMKRVVEMADKILQRQEKLDERLKDTHFTVERSHKLVRETAVQTKTLADLYGSTKFCKQG